MRALLALRLADRLGFDDGERGTLYYSGLLAWVGCHTDAYEQAKWFGDDLSLKRDAHYGYDFGRSSTAAAFMLRNIGGPGRPLVERARVGVAFLGDGRRAIESLAENHYRATDELAARLRLSDEVRESLRQSYERWDGKGAYKLKGEEIALSSRLMNLADVVEVFQRTRGLEAALGVARERSGTQFDPALVELFCERAPELFEELDSATSWEAVIDAEPSLARELSEEEVDEALAAIGEFAELKSPWTMGHAAGVAALCAAAVDEVAASRRRKRRVLRRASCVHDLGRLGVSNAIWDKPGPLSPSEVERVRLHPYLSERMLSFSPGAGADWRARRPAPRAAGRLRLSARAVGRDDHTRRATARGGRCLPGADGAAAAPAGSDAGGGGGHRSRRGDAKAASTATPRARSCGPPGTACRAGVRGRCVSPPARSRCCGCSRAASRTRRSREQLVISPKTAGSHVENIYAKTGAANRAQASLFAVKHGLLADAYQ